MSESTLIAFVCMCVCLCIECQVSALEAYRISSRELGAIVNAVLALKVKFSLVNFRNFKSENVKMNNVIAFIVYQY